MIPADLALISVGFSAPGPGTPHTRKGGRTQPVKDLARSRRPDGRASPPQPAPGAGHRGQQRRAGITGDPLEQPPGPVVPAPEGAGSWLAALPRLERASVTLAGTVTALMDALSAAIEARLRGVLSAQQSDTVRALLTALNADKLTG